MRESIAVDWAFGTTGPIENSVVRLSNTVPSSIEFAIEFAKCALSTGLPAVRTKIWDTTATSVYFAALPSSDDLSYMTAAGLACCPVRGPRLTDPGPTRTSNEPTVSWLRMWFAEKPAARHPETSDTT
jgi:hypothetical protein